MLVTNLREKISAEFSDLEFDEQRHIYSVRGIKLPSVSSKVESHSPKFDTEGILPWSAKKHGVDIDTLRKKWVKTNQDACDLGHETHDFLEEFTGVEKAKTPYEAAGVNFIRDISKDYIIVFRELRMYSRKYRYAGTEDLLLMHKERLTLATADYKTNGDIFKNYKGQRLLSPFDDLENTPFNKAQIQFTYYEVMLEEIGCPIAEKLLVYLRADGVYKVFRTINLMDRVLAHLDSKKVINDNNCW